MTGPGIKSYHCYRSIPSQTMLRSRCILRSEVKARVLKNRGLSDKHGACLPYKRNRHSDVLMDYDHAVDIYIKPLATEDFYEPQMDRGVKN